MHYNVDGSTAGSGTSVEFSRQGYFPQGQYTFSFYVKGDLTNTNLGIGFRNSVGSGTDEVNFSPITDYGNYTDWTRVVRTFTINLAPHANNKFLNLEFAGMPAGVKFTGLQLEIGDTATPFEHENIGTTLQKCQRFFQRLNSNTCEAHYLEVNNQYAFMKMQTVCSMRTIPSVSCPDFRTRYLGSDDSAGAGVSRASSGYTPHGNYSDSAQQENFNMSNMFIYCPGASFNRQSGGYCWGDFSLDAEL
jgi:hypothetical protein